MEIKLKKGKKYSICSCGLSDSLPFCDNSHREYNTDHNANYKSVKIIPREDVAVDVNSSCWQSIQEDK